MPMIKILYLHAGAEMYGADKVLLDLLINLDKKKFIPFVLLPSDGPLLDSLISNGIYAKVMEYPILRRKYFNFKGIVSYCYDFIRYRRKLLKFTKEHKIDLLHVNTAAVLEGISIKLKCKIPMIWWIHEIIVSPQVMFKFTSFLINKYSDIVITDSEAVKNHLRTSTYFKIDKIRVIYNGVDSSKFYPKNISATEIGEPFNIPAGKIKVGMMARVNSWKGQSDFLDALEIVLATREDVYAILVGSAYAGEEWRVEALTKRVKTSEYKERIIMCGYRSDSMELYNLFDILVLPSVNPDPLPTVVLEAMACGKPIVGYRHGGVCEMVLEGENGLLAEVRNTADLANKIILLIENDKVRKAYGISSRERLLNNFSLSSYISKFEELYNELFEKGRKNI